MAQNAAACFLASAFRNLVRYNVADSAQTEFAAFHVALHLFAVFRSRTFCDHNNSSQIASRLPRFDHARDLVEIEWNFRNQNDIGPAGDAAVQRDPAGVASHYFHNHDASVTARRSMHPIECVHYDGDGRIESECCRSGFEIVVDCLRNANAINTGFLQLLRSHHRAVAANYDQRLYLKLIQNLLGARNDVCRHNGPVTGANLGNKMAAIYRADDRAAKRHDSGNALAIENSMIARWKKSFESVTKPNYFPAKFL